MTFNESSVENFKEGKIELNFPSGAKWLKVTSLEEAFESIENFRKSGLNSKIVSGNTGTG